MQQDHGPEQSGYAGTQRPNLKDVNAAQESELDFTLRILGRAWRVFGSAHSS